MRTDLFDFSLPEDAIALRPAEPRDSARMLVVDPDMGFEDRIVRDLTDILRPGDGLVFNDTSVFPAQLEGIRQRSDGGEAKIGVTLHMRKDERSWFGFARGAKKLKEGDRLQFGDLGGEIVRRLDDGEIELRFDASGDDLDRAFDRIGSVPLPPYIAGKRPTDDRDRSDYQTVYARQRGAVAAPTAGLHFTERLIDELKAKGIGVHFVTLHVGAGTFLPVKTDETDEHRMHSEWGEVSPTVADELNAVRRSGGRIVSVGTTSLRLLESAVDAAGTIRPWTGSTDIFITPGYRFRAVDVLMTNFHLPRSTLFMLVSAFCGLETMQSAYAHAIESGYRFYSYGDSSLLTRRDEP